MAKDKVIFRADGNSKMGLGHVYRTLALASILKDDFICEFAIQNPNKEIENEILSVCDNLIVLPLNNYTTQELAPFLKGDEIVVLDGYAFTTDYQLFLKKLGCRVVCIDDIYAYHFVADVVINHAVGIEKRFYSVESYTKCFFGPEYLLLRKPFLHRDRNSQKIYDNIFINMGGADPDNETCKVLKNIIQFKRFKSIHVVIGPAFNYIKELQNVATLDERIILYKNLDANDLVELMSGCGFAICPPSTISLEYATIGGLMFLMQIADNQKDIKRFLLNKELAYDYEECFSKIINDLPNLMSDEIIKNQKSVFDGCSDIRLKSIFKGLQSTNANI